MFSATSPSMPVKSKGCRDTGLRSLPQIYHEALGGFENRIARICSIRGGNRNVENVETIRAQRDRIFEGGLDFSIWGQDQAKVSLCAVPLHVVSNRVHGGEPSRDVVSAPRDGPVKRYVLMHQTKRWGLSGVSENIRPCDKRLGSCSTIAIGDLGELNATDRNGFHRNPWASLKVNGLKRDLVGPMLRAKSGGNEYDANPRDGRSGSGRYHSPKSPLCHVPLGGQIGLAALMFAAGLFYVSHAIRKGGSIGLDALAIYALIGVGGVFSAVFVGLQMVDCM